MHMHLTLISACAQGWVHCEGLQGQTHAQPGGGCTDTPHRRTAHPNPTFSPCCVLQLSLVAGQQYRVSVQFSSSVQLKRPTYLVPNPCERFDLDYVNDFGAIFHIAATAADAKTVVKLSYAQSDPEENSL